MTLCGWQDACSWTCYERRFSSLDHLLCYIPTIWSKLSLAPAAHVWVSNMLFEPTYIYTTESVAHTGIILLTNVSNHHDVSGRYNTPICYSSLLDIFLQEGGDPVNIPQLLSWPICLWHSHFKPWREKQRGLHWLMLEKARCTCFAPFPISFTLLHYYIDLLHTIRH